MSFSEKPSPFNGLPSQSQVTLVTQQQRISIGSQSHSNSHSPQQEQQPQPINPWSSHTAPFGQSPSPFARDDFALSTTASATGELFLFGGDVNSTYSASNDLYMISTRDFSATPLKTSGDVPNPRWGHRAAFTSTTLLILGGWVTSKTIMRRKKYGLDDSLYLLDFASRKWSRVVANCPKPSGRCYHTVTLVGSKIFVFGGRDDYNNVWWSQYFNDIWSFDLNCVKSNPRWESYEPTPGNDEPLPRSNHVSVTTGNRIIIFGGCGSDGSGDRHFFNDTWSFNISTRKWTELRCTGSIPSPREGHTAALVDNVMYVFGGGDRDGIRLRDLTALDLSTQRWIAFRDVRSGPSRRSGHAMASDGPRIFLLGGVLSPGAKANEHIYVLDTTQITHPDLDLNAVDPREEASRLARESSTGPSTQWQLQQPRFSSSDSDFRAVNGTSPFQRVILGELGRPASLQIARERSRGLTGRYAELVGPGAPSEKEVAQLELEHGRIADLERQLSERDRHITQLTQPTGQLAQARGALQKPTSRADDANERSQCACEQIGEYETKLVEVRAELEEKKSELETVRLQLTDANPGWVKSSSAKEGQNTASPVNTDEDRDMRGIVERMRTMEAEIMSLRWSFERMECRNEG